MKKNYPNFKSLFLIVMLFLSITYTVKASHVQGGNITYACLGGNQFEVTLALYRDCAGVAAPVSVTINRRSITCGINANFVLTKIAGTGIEVTPLCPGSATQCTGGTLPGVQEYIYKGIVILPPCSDWVLSYSLCCRNAAIGTIVTPSSMNMYIEATLNNLAFPCNDSPTFTNRPVPFICVGQPFCFNNGSNDPDGDSLSYTLIPPRHTAAVNVTYIAPYSASQPLASTPAATFNPLTGDMCVTPTMIQVTVFAVLVKEWRGGILVGSVMRDIQIRTITCTNNNPYLNGINNTGSYSMNACAGVPITFNIPTFDADAAQNVTLTWNSGIPGASLNPGTGSRPTGVFTWTPTLADVSGVPHCFTATVTDNNCPFLGSQTYSFCITVGGFTGTSSTTNAICTAANGSASVNIAGGVLPLVYNWTPTGGSGPNATGLTAGSYTCTVTDDNGCSQPFPVVVNSTPGGTAAISSVTNVTCNGANNGTITVSMGGASTPPFTYAWTPASAGTSATAINLAPGTYSVIVTDANGCTSTVTQIITQPPVLAVSPTFVNVGCFGGSTGSATASPTGGTGPYSFVWMPGAFSTPSINSLTIGSYTVTVTDSKGCTTTGIANITQPPALAITASPTSANCGMPNGSATVSGTGGFAPYTWSWSNGQTGPSATGLTSGTYTVTITDLNLCTAQLPVTIGSIAGPTATISTFTNVACFGGNTGNATIGITGGSPPFTYLWSNGQTTPTANNLIAGIYSVTATDAAGCVASTSITITQPPLLVANAVKTNPICFGNSNGTATASAVGGTAPYSYSWTSPGSPTTSTVTGLAAGTYSVTITDSKGCVQIASVILVNPPALSTAIASVNVSCNAACNGTATATVSSGTPPYTYLWSNPAAQTTVTATGLCAGTFTVNVADANGCPSQAVTTITQPTLLTNVISSTGNLTCFGVCTGFAQVTAGGGTAPYTYSWMPSGGTTATATNLCAGSYTCTVTDSKGCTALAIATITQPTQLVANVTGTDINCFGTCDGTGNIGFSGGTPPYTFLWTPSMQTVFNPNNLCPGVNSATITDANGCAVSGSVTLTQAFTAVTVTTSTTSSNCGQSNGGACATVSGGLAPYTYIWNDPTVTMAICADSLPAGTYSVDVTDANGCMITTVANVNDISAPTVAITAHTDLLCFGLTNGTATTSITGGVSPYGILWTPGGQTTPNPVNLAGGVNTITVTDAAGCVSSQSVTILEPPVINHAISSITNVSCFGICDGAATVLAAGGTGSLAFSWNDPASQTTGTATGLCAGNFIVVITDDNGCTVMDTALIVSQPSSLAISSSAATNITCFGDNDGSITTTVTGGTPFYTFTWSPAVSTAPVANSLAPGTYTLTVNDQNGCTATQNWTITQPALLTDTSSFTSATCSLANGTALVTPAGGTIPYTYQWNDPALQTTPTATGLYAGTYNVIVTDSHGCITTQSYVINDLSGPVIDTVTSTPVLCFGGNSGSATVTVVPGTGTSPLTYQWSPGSATTISATSLQEGTYTVVVTDLNGCTAAGVVVVTEPPLLQLFVSMNDTICYGDTAQVYATASGGTPGYSYFWIGASGSGLSGSGPHMVLPSTSGTYTALVLDNNGCSAGPLDMFITVRPPVSVIASDTAICDGDAATIYANASGGNNGPYTYTWSNGINTQYQVVNPATGVVTTNYIVTVSDGCSLTATDTSTVTLNPGSLGLLQGFPTSGCEPLIVAFTGASNNGVSYTWNFGDGNTGSGSSVSNTYMNDGTYDVSVTILTAAGCATTIDSLAYVTVNPSPDADFIATPNPVSSLSPLVSFTDLSTVTIISWNWNFGDQSTLLDVSTLQNPTYEYSTSGFDTVRLIVTNQFGCTDMATNIVEVIDDFVFFAPNAFTPDGDGINDTFLPKGIGYDITSFSMMIFDRWGNMIFTTDDHKKGWDGKANQGADIAQMDVYVWKVSLKDNKNSPHKYTGHVTLVK
ncbi:MAG: PKD domain-containing protein [Bacteroidota bacterium]|nr:PKD domain-containing protein [Bacteroidota bacterium]